MEFTNKEDALNYKEYLELKGKPIPQSLLDDINRFEALENVTQEELFFGTMAANSRFMTEEKEKVVREMVDQLMKDDDKAKQPCLLLGKVQCGKTDTFESIIGLCFDKGIDIAIVLTKGTRTLTNQTIKRLQKDFGFFEDKNTFEQKNKVTIYDILDLNKRGGLSNFQLNDPSQKFIIVAKKETKNMEYLIELFQKDAMMRDKRVLVCDDEADFASRAYAKVKGKEGKMMLDLYRIAELIEELIKLPKFCRYLQITATPYSLYLQPDGTVKLRDDKEASSWLPRYTGLVPIHDRYVGGKEYFIESEKGEITEDGHFIPGNMYGYLYEPVTEDCRKILSFPDDFYIDDALHSGKLDPINYAVVGYMVATAIRYLQQEEKYRKASDKEKEEIEKYASSCLIHCEIAKDRHEAQEKYITAIIENIKKILLDETVHDLHLLDLERDAYESFKASNELANEQGMINEKMPSFLEVENEVKRMLKFNDYSINIVNSDHAIDRNEKGQLKLVNTMNFFIGGSILDRGITIDNMLCFFYGRFPSTTQMDTALQHARMYGPRSKEDMACTRFFTTPDIYEILKKINQFDNYIYEYLKANRGSVQTDDFTRILIGYDSHIAPTAQAKYAPANTRIIQPHQRTYPLGFQTLEPDKCAPIVEKIDDLLVKAMEKNKPGEDGFFLMSYEDMAEILKLIASTYTYDAEYHNLDRVWNPEEMLIPLRHILFNTDGLMWVKVRPNRELSREREDVYTSRGRFIDAPEAGSEVRENKEKAVDRPVVVILKQKGAIEQGWRGTPFYWPVITYPQDMESGIFTLDGDKKQKAQKKQIALETLENYPKEEVLKLTIGRDELFEILDGDTTSITREIKRTNARLFLAKDMLGNSILVEGTDPDKKYHLSSYNDGVFPYEIHPYKYLYLRASMDNSGSQAILELDEANPYELIAKRYDDKDIRFDAENDAKEVTDESKCEWKIKFNIEKVLESKLSPNDKEAYEAYLNSKN